MKKKVPLLHFNDANASRYVRINENYSAYRLVDVLQSRGNPIIGHQISERLSYFKEPVYKRRGDVRFLEFLEPFLYDIKMVSFDNPPLKDLYLRVKERESHLKSRKDYDKYVFDQERQLGKNPKLEHNLPSRIKRWQLLKLECDYQLARNARMLLEDMCAEYLQPAIQRQM